MTSKKKLEILDKIITGLKSQGEIAFADGRCFVHLEKDGKILRCATGFLIRDGFYDDVIEEDTTPENIERQRAMFRLSGFEDSDWLFLNRIISTHDRNSDSLDKCISAFESLKQSLE